MGRRWLVRALVVLAPLCLVGSARSQNAPSAGFNLCITPMRPACIDAAETYASKADLSLCQDKVQDYTKATIVYRACMYREAERAVLQLNNSLQLFKCRIPQHDRCRAEAADH